LLAAAEVQGIRLSRTSDYTRLVLDLSGPVKHKIIVLQNPSRLVIDIPDTALLTSLTEASLVETGIKHIRSGVRDGDDLRIVLDMQGDAKPRSFLLEKSGVKKDRLVIDLYGSSSGNGPVVRSLPAAGGKRDIVIAIDAGHGGQDPGALGPKRLREKDVVLGIARKLESRLRAAGGYRPVMVRAGDQYIGLDERRKIARGKRADLFVSIHADAFNNAKVSGSSVYALSQRGATSTTARFLANSENSADQIGGIQLHDKDDVLAGVLFDLSMTANLDASLSVGNYVLQSMAKLSRLHKRTVEQANFVVLRSPDIPSILIETGFISNPQEARKLSTRDYQSKMAAAIYKGLTHYFESNPPEGTLVSWRQHSRGLARHYVVSRGDTLGEIAQRYKVSLNSLRRSNGLKGNNIRIGQKLQIPTT
jgi:N-acetylmuramoyl-L-alanine amidase